MRRPPGATLATIGIAYAALAWGAAASAHGRGDSITWNREISRLVFDKCASCHRPEGTAFSLLAYSDAQPRATAIKDAVLSRRMPPWGAVKGFARFRNDGSLSQEQVELVTKWVDGGSRRGNNPNMLPKVHAFATPPNDVTGPTIRIAGTVTLERSLSLAGLVPEQIQRGQSMQIVAVRPDGRMEPLVWLNGYDPRFPHSFLFARPVALPAGTIIRGVPPGAVISLITRPPGALSPP